jgi:hypothetical protein
MHVFADAASRGSTGGKLLAGAMAITGALQIVTGTLLREVCVASRLSMGLLWAGGIGAIVLGLCESSDDFNDSEAVLKLKESYKVWHAVGALAFIILTSVAIIIIGDPIALPFAIVGLGCFFSAVFMQQLTGNWVGKPEQCCLPQRPEQRNPDHPKFGRCHKWLDSPSNRIALSRLVLTLELVGASSVIFSVVYTALYESVTAKFCKGEQFLQCFQS